MRVKNLMIIGIVVTLLVLAFWGGIAYIAAHFITKFW